MKPILALTGPNPTAKRDYLQKILTGIAADEITTYFADEAEAGVIIAQCSQDSLFGSNNIVIVRNLDEMSDKNKKLFEEVLGKYLENPNPSANLILLAEKFNAGITSLIQKAGEIQEFRKPYRSDLVRTASEKLQKSGIKYEPDLSEYLVTMSNEESEELDMMLGLVLSYAGKKGGITIEEAKTIVSRSRTMNVFDFIEGVFNKDAVKSLNALEDLRLSGEAATRINYMLLRTAKQMWGYLALKNKSDASQVLKIKPFEVKNLSQYARKTDMRFISAVIEMASKVEIKIKSMPEDFAYLEYETFLLAMQG